MVEKNFLQGLGLWNVYFICKFALAYFGYLTLNPLANAVLLAFLLLPFDRKVVRILQTVVGLIAGFILIYSESWLPGLDSITSNTQNIAGFSFNYIIQLAIDFVNLKMVAWGLLILFAYFLLRRWIRVTVLTVGYFAVLALQPMLAAWHAQEQAVIPTNGAMAVPEQTVDSTAVVAEPTPGNPETITSETIAKWYTAFLEYEKSQPSTINRYNAFVCGHCGRKLSYSKDRKKLICRYGESNPNASCYKAAYPAGKIKGAVLEALKWHFEQFIDWEEMQERLEKNVKSEQGSQDYEKVLEQIESGKIILYEKYKDGQIDRDEFDDGRDKLKAQAEEIKERMKEAALRREVKDEVKRIGEMVRKYREAKELTKEMEEMFVERVEVYDQERIKVKWKFEVIFGDLNLAKKASIY